MKSGSISPHDETPISRYIAAKLGPLLYSQSPLLLQTRFNHTHTPSCRHRPPAHRTIPFADGELCQLPLVELMTPNEREFGHDCRGACGGRLHGFCSVGVGTRTVTTIFTAFANRASTRAALPIWPGAKRPPHFSSISVVCGTVVPPQNHFLQ